MNKSRIFVVILLLCTMICVCACGSSAVMVEADGSTEMIGSQGLSHEDGDQPAGENASREKAISLIGSEVSLLISEIGEPNSSEYAPSCLGSGEDGALYYDGFVVTTYREGNSEIIKTVD